MASIRHAPPPLSTSARHYWHQTNFCTSIREGAMQRESNHYWKASTRRQFFGQAGSGLAAIALASMLAEEARAAGSTDPLDPKPPHVTPRAKSVIFCFMEGGPSHVDLFDPKPGLLKYQGQPVPESFHPETLGVTG